MSSFQPQKTSYTLRGPSSSSETPITEIDTSIVLGRSGDCDLVLSGKNVSRRHCKFFMDQLGNLIVQDLNSHNGTYVDGERVIRSILHIGSKIRVGTNQFEIGQPQPSRQVSTDPTPESVLVGAQLVKEANTVSLPYLNAMSSDEYINALGIASLHGEGGTDKRFAQLSRYIRHFAGLFEISQILQREQDQDELLSQVMNLLLSITGGSLAYVALRDDTRALVPRAVVHADHPPSEAENDDFELSKTVTDYVMQQRCGVIISDTLADARFSESDSLHSGVLRSLIAVPILVGQRVLGLIAACNDAGVGSYKEIHLDLLCVVASMVGPALQNIELAQQREDHIAKLQAAQQELINAQAQLVQSEKMAAIGRLSSGIMHEVKNHLSPLMLADMVASNYPDDAEAQEMSELVLEARNRILELVDEIRRFARGDESTYHFHPSDLSTIAKKVARFVRCDAVFQQVDFLIEAGDQLIAKIDEDRIRQVLINLLRNAAEATDESPQVRLRVQQRGDLACIEVEDNGKGIPTEIGEKIFESLFTTKGDNGIGLGLDISRRIVHAHGGTLTFASKPGQTIFTISLPASRD